MKLPTNVGIAEGYQKRRGRRRLIKKDVCSLANNFFVTLVYGKIQMRTHNNKLLFLIALTLLLIYSCTRNSTPPSEPAQKEASSIAAASKMSPMENYIHDFMETVRQYWAFSSPLDEPMACTIDVDISSDGEIVAYKLIKSSGNKYFDNSAQNAIVRTQRSGVRLPPPEPLPKGLTIIFNLPESSRR
ncbi:energy transducer TonB [Desulfovibrio desulfuricans]|uniref:energy transducer TonB n=1 Tax=Desulfovibrio desulfuricans TaxID=876 RepID=UPI0003B4B440|nr:energy transducer TonB [Desulfovibrio desulfuricans]